MSPCPLHSPAPDREPRRREPKGRDLSWKPARALLPDYRRYRARWRRGKRPAAGKRKTRAGWGAGYSAAYRQQPTSRGPLDEDRDRRVFMVKGFSRTGFRTMLLLMAFVQLRFTKAPFVGPLASGNRWCLMSFRGPATIPTGDSPI